MHANSEIEETGPRFCRNSTSHVCQICRFKYNQINNYSFQVASSLLLFIIIIDSDWQELHFPMTGNKYNNTS